MLAAHHPGPAGRNGRRRRIGPRLFPQDGGVYRPRHPQQTPFYQLVERFFPQFEAAYEERYQERYGFWRPIIGTVVRKFLECGDLKHGFARVRCPKCREEVFALLLAEGRITEEVVANMRSWKHSGFSVDPSVRLEAGDQEGIQRLIQSHGGERW